jgi:hypothetical protein
MPNGTFLAPGAFEHVHLFGARTIAFDIFMFAPQLSVTNWIPFEILESPGFECVFSAPRAFHSQRV